MKRLLYKATVSVAGFLLAYNSFVSTAWSQDYINEDGSIQIEGQTIQISPDLLEGQFYVELDDSSIDGLGEIQQEDEITERLTNWSLRLLEPLSAPVPEQVTVEAEKRVYITNYVTNEIVRHHTNYIRDQLVKPVISELLPSNIELNVGYEFVRARRMILGKQYERALLILHTIEQVEPHSTRLYNMRGSVYYKLGFYDYAIMNWEKSLKINSQQNRVRKYLNQIRLKRINS